MFRLEHGNAVRIVATEKKRDELIEAGYKLVEDKGGAVSKPGTKTGAKK